MDSIQVRSAAPAQVQRASEEVLDSVYSFLLSNVLELSPMHRQGLNERGLKDDQINKREYRSMPITTAIVRRWIGDVVQTNFPRSTLLGVPGFYADKFSEVCLGAMPGLLIPVRTDLGRIIALKLRRDTTQHGQPKYLSVSSSRNGGPGPGAPVHVPLFGDTVSEIVWATEGELKADVATALRGGLTISFPGVNSWPTIIPVLKRLNAKEVVLAFDADARTNPTVAAALSGAFKGLKALGFCVKIATWNGDSNGE